MQDLSDTFDYKYIVQTSVAMLYTPEQVGSISFGIVACKNGPIPKEGGNLTQLGVAQQQTPSLE